MRVVLLATSAISLALPGLALAQSAALPAPKAPPAPAASESAASPKDAAAAQVGGPGRSTAAQGAQLGEVVVTAQRREETLQRAAVAVDVVTGADLVSQGITQVDRLNNLVPALTVQPGSNGNIVFIRGVGNFTLTPNADPAVAFNYDGVYIGRPVSTSGVFFDLQRVEVLKGPQGTLYGRNATGGAINVIPVQPKLGDLSGYGSLSYGDYNQIIGEGAVNVPLGDTAAARLSVQHASHDGFFKDGTDDQDQTSVRLQVKGEITPDITARISGDYSHSGGAGESTTYLGNYVFNPATASYTFRPSNLDRDQGLFTAPAQAYRTTIVAGPAGRNYTPLSPYPNVDNNFYGTNAQVDWKTPYGTLTLVPSYRHSDVNYIATGGAFPLGDDESDSQYSVEARFQGNRVGIFDYTLGFLYYHENVATRTALTLGAAATFQDQHFSTESYAPFARVTAHLTDRFRLVGGIRYTNDDKTFYGPTTSLTLVCLVRVNGVPTCPANPLLPYVSTLAQEPIAVPALNGPPVPVFNNGVPTGAIDVRTDRNDNSKLSNDKVTYRGAAEYDLTSRSLVYASIETGYRSGGFNPATGFETFNPETITAYTVGSKNRFFNNRLQLNVEGFWWEYKNQQVSSVQNDLAGRTVSITQNIGRSRIRGVEFDGQYLLTPTTLVSTDIQYLDTTDKSFTYAAANSGTPPLTGCPYKLNTPTQYQINCAGFPAFNSPKWTINFAGQQTFHVSEYDIVLGLDTQYKSGLYGGFGYLAQTFIHPQWLTNAQVSFGPASGHWSISGYIRNLEGRRTPTFIAVSPFSNALVADTIAPRTYGARVAYKF